MKNSQTLCVVLEGTDDITQNISCKKAGRSIAFTQKSVKVVDG